MNKSIMKKNLILKIVNNSILMLPTPMNISIWWNIGSILGLCMMIQIISGLFLSMNYCANTMLAFDSIIHIIQDVNYGWILRLIHMNGSSLFFIFLYIHIGRGLYYGSHKLFYPWMTGIIIFFLIMGTAFMGYVLPWGQMSYWGATVITSLISTIPYCGQLVVEWIWGGFSVNNPTLNRFFSFHFIMPLIASAMIMIHLMFLHETGSNNPLGINSNNYKIPFNNYFIIKDIYGYMIVLFLFFIMILMNPYLASDPENFMKANAMVTPIHIQPEWYFLFTYSILRSIPSKFGGVIALMLAILILMILPFLKKNNFQNLKFYPLNKYYFWYFTSCLILMTWSGAQPVEYPYVIISQILSIFYFCYYFINYYMMLLWDKFLN